MNYDDFISRIKGMVQQHMGEEVHVRLHQVMKNNTVRMDGLCILEKDMNISPTIYLHSYFDSYQSGITIPEIVEDIIRNYDQSKVGNALDTTFYTDFNKVKDQIACKLVNFEKNRELLKRIPFVRYLDLAVVYYYMLENEELGNGTILIYRQHLEMWGISEEDIYRIARQNTPRLLPFVFHSMKEVIEDALGEGEVIPLQDDSVPMYVLSNDSKSLGAVEILYDSVLAHIGVLLKESYYILPSSIHECIIVPGSISASRSELEQMVCEINESQVLPEEVLSDQVYFYDRDKHFLSL